MISKHTKFTSEDERCKWAPEYAGEKWVSLVGPEIFAGSKQGFFVKSRVKNCGLALFTAQVLKVNISGIRIDGLLFPFFDKL